MSANQLDDIAACVFDAYGTLFDVHSAVGALRPRLEPKADAVSATWRDKQVQYTWLRSLMGRHGDFWEVTGDALDYALEQQGVDDAELREKLMQAYLKLSPYPEVPATLATLREHGLKRAILSNGSPAMLEAAVNNASLVEAFDAVLSVESVGIYKPDPRVYQLAVDQLGVERERIAFMSSNAWDAAGAASFGFRVVWINRFGQPRERLPGEPAAQLTDLAGLPGLLGA